VLLIRFDWDAEELVGDLRFAEQILCKRLRLCGIKAEVQPSLGDREARNGGQAIATRNHPLMERNFAARGIECPDAVVSCAVHGLRP